MTTRYTVYNMLDAGFTLEPAECLRCGVVGETTWNQLLKDAYCAVCGTHQRAWAYTHCNGVWKLVVNREIQYFLAERKLRAWAKKNGLLPIVRSPNDPRGFYVPGPWGYVPGNS